ncbi:hypothetical protein D3C80_1222720 [compost metagenome]
MVHVAIKRGEQNDRAIPLRAQIATHGHTVFSGQHDIQQDQIGFFTQHNLFCAVTAWLNDDIHIVFSEVGGDKLANFGFILNKNDLIHKTSVSRKMSTYTASPQPSINLS